jgi:hypothetical protein
MNIVRLSGSDPNAFITVMENMKQDEVAKKRNSLAHGGAISYDIATQLRASILGKIGSKTGILCWMAEHLEPKR